MKINFIAIIPARYSSTRFPGKPLAMLGDKYVIQRVCEQASKVLDSVYVATDDVRIEKAVESFGVKAIMTRADHQSGTDRLFEAYQKLNSDCNSNERETVIINIQGDEPFILPEQITELMRCFDDPNTQIATLVMPFNKVKGCTIETIKNPNSPKVVIDDKGYAMYFSRSVVPYLRGLEEQEWPFHYEYMKHIGIYAYRADVLSEITKMPQSPLELTEKLEQLRWLQAGYRIKVGVTDMQTIGIDTPEDLKQAELFLQSNSNLFK